MIPFDFPRQGVSFHAAGEGATDHTVQTAHFSRQFSQYLIGNIQRCAHFQGHMGGELSLVDFRKQLKAQTLGALKGKPAKGRGGQEHDHGRAQGILQEWRIGPVQQVPEEVEDPAGDVGDDEEDAIGKCHAQGEAAQADKTHQARKASSQAQQAWNRLVPPPAPVGEEEFSGHLPGDRQASQGSCQRALSQRLPS